MRIDNTYIKNVDSANHAASAGAVRGGTAKAAPAPSAAPGVSLHIPSPELVNYLQGLQSVPEVRSEVLAVIVDRLTSGYYTSNDAAQQTAAAILQSSE